MNRAFWTGQFWSFVACLTCMVIGYHVGVTSGREQHANWMAEDGYRRFMERVEQGGGVLTFPAGTCRWMKDRFICDPMDPKVVLYTQEGKH